MEVRIQAIHFDISDRLTAFINKKIDKMVRRYENINTVEVNLRVIKPESAMNKEVIVKAIEPLQPDLVATKTADTFEEAVDKAIEAVERQLEKRKEKYEEPVK